MSLELVRRIKDECVAAGADLAGACGALKITKRVAWAMREQGAGLLDKPTGNNCDGYAADIVVFRDGNHYDILIDGGGRNEPSWQPKGLVDPNRWRAPVNDWDTEPQPTPPPVPPVPIPPSPFDLQIVTITLTLTPERAAALLAWLSGRP